ncbi:unnamed protein product [Sympodiomycopsis kandeliae]
MRLTAHAFMITSIVVAALAAPIAIDERSLNACIGSRVEAVLRRSEDAASLAQEYGRRGFGSTLKTYVKAPLYAFNMNKSYLTGARFVRVFGDRVAPTP